MRKRLLDRRIVLGAALAVLVVAPRAGADATAERRADAEFEAGIRIIQSSAPDWRAAVSHFRASQDAAPSAGALANLADCEDHLALRASAFAHIERALALLPPGDARRSRFLELRDKLATTVQRVRVELGRDAPSSTTVKLDGGDLSLRNGAGTAPVDPGPHVVTASAPGWSLRRYEFVVTEGRVPSLVVVELRPTTPATASPAAPAAPSAEASIAPARTIPPAGASSIGGGSSGYVALGLGGAALALGLVGGALALNAKATVADHCVAKVCDQEGLAAVDDGRRWTTVGTAASIIGLAGLGTGVFLVAGGGRHGDDTAMVAGAGSIRFRAAF